MVSHQKPTAEKKSAFESLLGHLHTGMPRSLTTQIFFDTSLWTVHFRDLKKQQRSLTDRDSNDVTTFLFCFVLLYRFSRSAWFTWSSRNSRNPWSGWFARSSRFTRPKGRCQLLILLSVTPHVDRKVCKEKCFKSCPNCLSFYVHTRGQSRWINKYLTLTFLKGLQLSPEVIYRSLYISPILHDVNTVSKYFLGFDMLVPNLFCFFG